MATLNVPPNYGFVLLTLLSAVGINVAHTLNTSSFRKAASVPYPFAYAPEARTDRAAVRFNSAQRAHAQFTEHFPSFVVALLVAGVEFPLVASVLGAGWVLSRFMYMRGYSLGLEGGKGRVTNGGTLYFVFAVGLYALVGWMGVGLIMGW